MYEIMYTKMLYYRKCSKDILITYEIMYTKMLYYRKSSIMSFVKFSSIIFCIKIYVAFIFSFAVNRFIYIQSN